MLKFFAVEDESKLSELMIYVYIDAADCFLRLRNDVRVRGKIVGNSGVGVARAARAARRDQQALFNVLKSRDGFNFADYDEFLKWYRWWYNWHKHVLTNDEWNLLNSVLQNDPSGDSLSEDDLSKWRPRGNWRDS